MHISKCLKEDVRSYINSIATLKGTNSWVILPKSTNLKGRVCLVAHVDTVHEDTGWGYGMVSRSGKVRKAKDTDKELYYDSSKRVYWSPDGLGADDRAGVYACLQIFDSMPESHKPIILFTDGEEYGGIGANEVVCLLDTDYSVLKDVSYFIELDRKGGNDCVFYNGESREFKRYIKGFGFKEDMGSFTDISIICPEVGICGVNLSVGYYHQHTDKEILKMDELEAAIATVKSMIKANDGTKWVLHKKKDKYLKDALGFTLFDMYGEEEQDSVTSQIYASIGCPACDSPITEGYLHEVIVGNMKHIYCGNCLTMIESVEIKVLNGGIHGI